MLYQSLCAILPKIKCASFFPTQSSFSAIKKLAAPLECPNMPPKERKVSNDTRNKG